MRPDLTDAESGEVVLATAVQVATDTLGNRLMAAYALGSLAHGGFSPKVSDVDLGLILRDPLKASDDSTVNHIATTARGGGSALHERLSLFWGTPSTLGGRVPGGRFPALDRLDLIEHGRLLAGAEHRGVVARPSQRELLIAGAEFALDFLAGGLTPGRPATRGLGSMTPADESVLGQIRTPRLLLAQGPRQVTKIVLFPVRFLYTAATGNVGTMAIAVEFYCAQPRVPARALVQAAHRWRLAPIVDGEAAALLGRGLVPLYRYYIDDHIPRLLAAGRPELAKGFAAWRGRI